VPSDQAKFGYAVFGKVVQGMEVVDAIASVETTSKGMYRDVPVEPVLIISVSRMQ
jgi:cyclophilin family peptidyl-prolyl cis-trans isomerase